MIDNLGLAQVKAEVSLPDLEALEFSGGLTKNATGFVFVVRCGA
jgi:hypothetical protein